MRLRKQKSWAWLLPIFLWSFLFLILPLVLVFFLSFMSRDNLGNLVFSFSLEHYQKILTPMYLKIFYQSFKLAFLTSLLSLIIGYPVAYFMTLLSKRLKALALVLLMIPFWTSSLMRTYSWSILLGRAGIINQILLNLNIIDQPLEMMYRFTTVLVGTVYMLLPFMILSIYNSVDKLDASYLEASLDLGAGRFQTFMNIILPLSLPGVIRGISLVFIPSLGMYFVSDLLGGGQMVFLSNLINNQVSKGRNRPLAAALSMVMILLILIFLYFQNRLEKRVRRDLS